MTDLSSNYMMANIKIPIQMREDGTYHIFSDLYSIEFSPYEMPESRDKSEKSTLEIAPSITTILASEIKRRHIGDRHITTLKNVKRNMSRFSRRNISPYFNSNT